jgi:outer membrane protein assembly factor BamB
MSEPLLVADNSVYFGSGDNTTIKALRTSDGAQLWQYGLASFYAQPLLITQK